MEFLAALATDQMGFLRGSLHLKHPFAGCGLESPPAIGQPPFMGCGDFYPPARCGDSAVSGLLAPSTSQPYPTLYLSWLELAVLPILITEIMGIY